METETRAPTKPLSFWESAQRALRSDFGRDQATEEERTTLANGPGQVTEPLAQDYAAWRRSVLMLAAVVLVIGALIHLVNFETFSDLFVRQAVEMSEKQGGMPLDEDTALMNLNRNFGEGNLYLLDMIPIVSFLALLAVTILCVLSSRAWYDVRKSTRLARYAWYVLVGTPLLLALLPWSRWLDFGHLMEPNATQIKSSLSVGLGLFFFGVLAPKLISIFPGIIRASVSLKTMLHESPVPGYAVVLFAPVYAMFVLVIFTTINQIQGNLTMLLGLAFLAIAPLVYLWKARDFLRPHTAEESATLVRDVRRQSYLCNLVGTGLLVLALAQMEHVSTMQILDFLAMAGGGLLLMMVVAADLLLGLLRLEHEQAKRFVGSELASAFEIKLSRLTVAAAEPRQEEPGGAA